jgi:type IV secretion system protein VirB10
VGQAIYCQTVYPIAVSDRIVIPVGSYVKGAVAQVVRAGRVKGTAKIGLRFESITLRSGVTRPLRATLSGYGGNGAQGFSRDEGKIEGESSKKEDVERTASTGVQGALIGAIAGRGKGAGIGAGSGGAAGLIWVLATRGKEIVLQPGTSLELQLTAPLTLERTENGLPERYQGGPALPPPDIGSDN